MPLPGLPLEEHGAVVVLQGLELVRQGRLGQVQQLRGSGEIAGCAQCDDGLQVAQFEG